MYRRDLITAEIEKLAQVLARILGLKLELKLEEATLLFDETMLNSFSLSTSILNDEDNSPFKKWLNDSGLPAEKLDSLSDFLYYQLGASQEQNQIIATKLNMIYEHLSNKHKIVHLANMHRQNIIKQYL